MPVGDRRSKPYVPPPLGRVTPRWEPRFAGGVATCAVRSTAGAGLRAGGPCLFPYPGTQYQVSLARSSR